MENCLVTKLKGVVNNDNLVKLGYIRVKNGVTANDGVRANALLVSTLTAFSDSVILHNATQEYSIVSWSNRDAWCDVKKEKLYSLHNYGTYRNSFVINVEDLIGCSALIRLTATGINSNENGSYGNINRLGSMPNLQKLEIGDNPNIIGDVSKIPNISSNLTSVSINNTGLVGSADCFVDNGSLVCPLTTLEIGNILSGNSSITISVSTVVTCANNGCTVYAHENQIVWDTMTKDEFKAAYQSYPTPPKINWKS